MYFSIALAILTEIDSTFGKLYKKVYNLSDIYNLNQGFK